MHTDGSHSNEGNVVGVVIKGSLDIKITYVAQLEFTATNNTTEYEALLIGLSLLKELNPDSVKIRSDSSLVVNQVVGHFITKEDDLVKYRQLVVDAIKEVEDRGTVVILVHIDRSLNGEADILAKAAGNPDIHDELTCPFEIRD